MASRIIWLTKAEDLIPSGPYCYAPVNTPEADEAWKLHGIFKIKLCPYWEPYNREIHGDLPQEISEYQDNYDGAFCQYLKTGDGFPNGTSLLWDQVKECAVNDDD